MEERRFTIEELEKLLNSENDTPIEILPNGEIRAIGTANPKEINEFKTIIESQAFGETGDY